MKKIILIILTVLFFVSCKKSSNRLDIVISKRDVTDSAYINIDFLTVRNKDSIIYKAETHQRFDFLDTISLDSLNDDIYELAYDNMIGDRIKRKISLKGDEAKVLKIVFDSLSLDNFYNKIPFNSLMDGKSYTIESKGGCVASMFSYYKISRIQDKYYYQCIDIPKRLLKPKEIKAIQIFESELFAIQGKDLCGSTGRMTYTILQDEKKTSIVDNTCNWNGWSNLMRKVNTNEN